MEQTTQQILAKLDRITELLEAIDKNTAPIPTYDECLEVAGKAAFDNVVRIANETTAANLQSVIIRGSKPIDTPAERVGKDAE